MRTSFLARLAALLLALAVAPLPLTAHAGEAAPVQLMGPQLIDRRDRVMSFAYHDGLVHVLTRQAYYRWQPGDEIARQLPDVPAGQRPGAPDAPDGIDALFVYQGGLLALDALKGVVYDAGVTDTGLALTERLRLNWENFLEGEAPWQYVMTPEFATVIGDNLYVRKVNYQNLDTDLYVYSLLDGSMSPFPVTHLNNLVPYKDGRLLAVRYEPNKTDENGMPLPPTLQVMSASGGEPSAVALSLTRQARHGMGRMPLYYDAAADAAFVRNGDELTRLAGLENPQVTAYLSEGESADRTLTPGILPYKDGQLLVATQRNLFICPTDPETLAPVTTLSTNTNFMPRLTLGKAMLQLGNVRVAEDTDSAYEQSALFTQLMTGASPYDLLQVDTTYMDVQQLMRKGYLADLSVNPVLDEYVKDTLPLLDKATQLDGRVYAVPLQLQPTFLGVNTAVFKRLGREIPRTIPELIELARWWGEEGRHQAEDTILFDMHSAKRVMKELAFEAYKGSMMGRGEQLSFSMERFGKIMQDIDALPTEEWDLPLNYGSGDDDDEYLGEPAITPYAGYDPQYAYHAGQNEIAVALAFDDQSPAFAHAFCMLVAVPANSPRRDEAIRFLEAYVRSLDDMQRATFSRSWDKAVENPGYDWERRQAIASLDMVKARLSRAEGDAEKRELEASVQGQQENLDRIEQTGKYLLTQEQLGQHRALMAQVYVDDSLSRLANEALSRDGYMLHMYMDGALTLEQFVQQANDRIRLMTLEAK